MGADGGVALYDRACVDVDVLVDWTAVAACGNGQDGWQRCNSRADAGCACWQHADKYFNLSGPDFAAVGTPRSAALYTYTYCLAPGRYEISAVDEFGTFWGVGNGSFSVVDAKTGALLAASPDMSAAGCGAVPFVDGHRAAAAAGRDALIRIFNEAA